MKIAGFVKNTFIDYPSHIAAAVFAAGCNMDCWYCHNRGILGSDFTEVPIDEVMQFLRERRGMIEGLVISGGEPLLHGGVESFAAEVKALGYDIKLDTNGLLPERLAKMLAAGLVDYVAMDIKAPLEDYAKVTRTQCDADLLRQSIALITSSGIDYEFRTTFVPQLTLEDIERILVDIKGAKRYALQQYKKDNVPRSIPEYTPYSHTPEYIQKAAALARQYVTEVLVRGV